MQMAETILYISPHLDDVVFSCAAHIEKSRKEGNPVVVASLFTEGDHTDRKLEDLAALKMLDADCRWLGYLDAPFRNDYYNSFERIIFGDAKEDAPNISELVDAIQPHLIVAPLGVGNHIDHRMAFESVKRVKSSLPIIYYEDQPYASVIGATELRLNQLGYLSQLPNFETYWESFLQARYVRTYLPSEQHAAIKKRLQSIWLSSRTGKQAIRYSLPRLSSRAVFTYESQLDGFVDPNSMPTAETYWDLA